MADRRNFAALSLFNALMVVRKTTNLNIYRIHRVFSLAQTQHTKLNTFKNIALKSEVPLSEGLTSECEGSNSVKDHDMP